MESNDNPPIPDDVSIQILPFLPVKSLMRFMCVCKKWRSTIPNHIVHNITNREELLVASSSSIQSIDFNASEIKAVTIVHQFPFKQKLDTVGSANGLLSCVDRKNRGLILFNPLTQWHMTIRFPFTGSPEDYVYGFCYDESKKEYNIVIINRNEYTGDTWIQIWSSRTHTWSRTCVTMNPERWNFAFHHPNLNVALFVKGALYWKIMDSSSLYSALRFDLKTRKLNLIRSPMPMDKRSKRLRVRFSNFELVGLGDCVAFVNYDFIIITVWELNELDGFVNWTKIMSIPARPTNDVVGYFVTPPVFRLKNGEDVLVTRSFDQFKNKEMKCCFYVFNGDMKDLTRLKIEGIGGLQDVMIPYKKTLVSLSNKNIDRRQPSVLSPTVADPLPAIDDLLP